MRPAEFLSERQACPPGCKGTFPLSRPDHNGTEASARIFRGDCNHPEMREKGTLSLTAHETGYGKNKLFSRKT